MTDSKYIAWTIVFTSMMIAACSNSPNSGTLDTNAYGIKGGYEVTHTDYLPSAIVNLLNISDTDVNACTATFITENVALTAAHCVYAGKNLSDPLPKTTVSLVNFDNIDLENPSTIDFKKMGRTNKICAHRKYRGGRTRSANDKVNDIALIQVTALENQTHGIAQLPATNLFNKGIPLQVFGYGPEVGASLNLETAVVAVSSKIYKSGAFSIATGSQIQIIHGDSGGPAFQRIDGTDMLVGVASSAFADTAAYESTYFHREWIHQALNLLNTGTTDDSVCKMNELL